MAIDFRRKNFSRVEEGAPDEVLLGAGAELESESGSDLGKESLEVVMNISLVANDLRPRSAPSLPAPGMP